MARLIQPMVRASSGGRTSSASIGGMRQMRIASISALRPMRSTSDSACFRFNRPLSPSLERWSIVRAYRPSPRVGTLRLPGRSAGTPGRTSPPDPPTPRIALPGRVHVPQGRSCWWPHRCSWWPPVPAKATATPCRSRRATPRSSALQAAPDAVADAGTGRFEMVMEMTVMGEPLELVATGAYDADAQQMSMSMDMGAMFEQLAGRHGRGDPRWSWATARWRWSPTATPSTCARRCSRCSPAPRAGCR